MLTGVVPRLFRPGATGGGSMDVLRDGVCIPDGVDVPLKFRLKLKFVDKKKTHKNY